jgi:hypothetical protein
VRHGSCLVRIVVGGALLAAWLVFAGCVEMAPDAWMYGYDPMFDPGYPAWGLYDPTADIQSVIDYRQDVMDWSNDAWDAYIRGPEEP